MAKDEKKPKEDKKPPQPTPSSGGTNPPVCPDPNNPACDDD